MKAEFTAHFFFTAPPYRIRSPGMLWSPTSVAAVSCHALSALFIQSGLPASGNRLDGNGTVALTLAIFLIPFFYRRPSKKDKLSYTSLTQV
ncbi:hypothetical protein PanWU01x14_199910 [Parasponia andersonii]|uniref:Uncharacterized protein n=1 Tax=Parasponia andersonii TaxID=3476 RepID=A0A2P5BYJ5_PARAD|nr:hypothetical protein PanWU01x14_199910 [Parasponia andersonii]